MYKLDQSEYKKLPKENITNVYKKSNQHKEYNNSHTKRIREKLPISDRIETLQETEVHIITAQRGLFRSGFVSINKPFKIKYSKHKAKLCLTRSTNKYN